MPDASDPPTAIAAATHAALAIVLGLWAASGAYRLRGTTLAAPAWWTVAAAAALAIVELAVAGNPDWGATLAASLARYAASVGALCPLVAVLGAKRPQDRGWQWIVASLWIVLLVPAGQAWAAHANELTLAPMWRLLAGGLIALGLLNYLPTRYAAPALLTASAQWQLVFAGESSAAAMLTPRGAALLALVAAALLAEGFSRRAPRNAPAAPGSLSHATQRWLAFRNGWGAFWGLRVRNRINEAAALAKWPVRLHWSGFAPATDDGLPWDLEVDSQVAAHIEQTMDSVLRRFERIPNLPPAPSPRRGGSTEDGRPEIARRRW